MGSRFILLAALAITALTLVARIAIMLLAWQISWRSRRRERRRGGFIL